ncbi:MAG: fluoride efflux transporter CrcB [Opitutaceae bacterium]|nr:fluoride efflux transporter CrcB [Opitutaceae bacterium]
MRLYFLVGLGGALGTVARLYLSDVAVRAWGPSFPWGTLLINVTGCLLIGFFIAATEPGGRWTLPLELRLAVSVGFCGGYTTFSAFSHQTLALFQEGAWARAGTYVLGSVVLCLAAVALGHWLGILFNTRIAR